MNNSEDVENLFQRYLDNKCTPDEIRVLLQHFGAGENEHLLKSLIHQQSDVVEDASLISDEASRTLLDAVFSKVKDAIAADFKTSQIRVIPFYRNRWFRVCTAATIVLMVSTTLFYFLNKENEKVIVQNEINIQSADIPSGTKNAVLTLDDGTTVMLDSTANGTLAQQGNIKVLKISGQISYNKTGTGNMNTKPIYNTITTANGNEYQLILADGSKVWLNAASSIRFPAFFAGNERKVEITGEAYFEVAHDASKPFKVAFKNKEGGSGEIEVLGTHFDVNTYDNESAIKTTLLEGSVKIKRANQVQMLSPGQQAVLTSDRIELKKDVDVSQVVAWKNGFFMFNNTGLQTIMRQVARWYNVEINFEVRINDDGYSGKISREEPLSKFLKVLELNGVHVKTDGRTVTVLP